MTATGTLTGMPALRGDALDALHPERWSHPPQPGKKPIVPCDEPEDEASAEAAAPWRSARNRAKAPAAAPPLCGDPPGSAPLWLPMRHVMHADERRLLTRAAIVAVTAVWVVTALLVLASQH